MADNTKIEWTDATWNPITGCSIVSPGCTNCYAMKLAGTRLRNHPSRAGLTRETKAGPVWTGEVRFNETTLTEPLRWKRPRMIFVCAHADLFAEDVPDEWIDRIFAVMALAPQHVFQVLTKRPERMRGYMTRTQLEHRIVAAQLEIKFPMSEPSRWPHMPLRNVWLGVSVEDQARADERIAILIDTPAAVRWISAEPLLGPVDIGRWTATAEVTCKACRTPFWLHHADPCSHSENGGWTLACPNCGGCRCRPGWTAADERTFDMEPPADWIDREVGRFDKVHPSIQLRSLIDWVVVGGESGADARPMHPHWASTLRDQCAAAGVPFLFKQWGNWQVASETNGHLDHSMRTNDAWWIGLDGRRAKPAYADLVDPVAMHRVPKKLAGRHLDGRVHDAFPPLPQHFSLPSRKESP